MFRETTYHVYIYASVAYAIMNLLPRNQQHYVMMVFLLAYMSSQHIYAMLTDFGGFNMDITTYTMILVCKLWMLSWTYRDGGEKPETLSKEQLANRHDMPTILQYLGYVFFCCGAIVGPSFEFQDYVNLMELKGNYKTLPVGLSKGWATLIPAMRELIGGFLVLGIHIYFTVILGFDIYFCGSEEFSSYKTMAERFVFFIVAMTS